ncbi:MAG: CDP-alcohol phosphatidyltransferase family protein [Nitrospiraceae bacterium]|nr:MAG: CDP-alcohol phosphatidyltransferase family protein [Nitrospiraceae bacterium]
MKTFFAHVGKHIEKYLTSLARAVEISPNTITIAGFIITIMASVVLTRNLFLGGLLIILGSLFDMFDGISARMYNKVTQYGAFLDSVIDRYSDSFLLTGFAWYFIKNGSTAGALLSVGTMVGALIISYARARAEGLGRECKTGLMERPERIVFMSLAALTGLVFPFMLVMFVLTHYTVIQRVYYVKKQMGEK